MEKICIVKRRRSYPVADTDQPHLCSTREAGNEGLSCAARDEQKPQGQGRGVSLELTPEQSRTIRSDIRLHPGKSRMVSLETRETEGGKIVFHFTLSPLYGGKLLSSGDVCWMLQVSRGLLARLVRAREIESYKIGRLRRFLLDDVLHYLGQSKERPWQKAIIDRCPPGESPEFRKE